jgi:hypothetical protein
MKERRELSKVAITRFRLIFALSLIGAPLLAILGLKSPVGDPGQAIFAIGGMGFVGCAVWAYRSAMKTLLPAITTADRST